MQPLFTPDTLESLEAYQAASARDLAVREPDPAACHNLVFSATGAIVDATYPDWVSEKLLAGVSPGWRSTTSPPSSSPSPTAWRRGPGSLRPTRRPPPSPLGSTGAR